MSNAAIDWALSILPDGKPQEKLALLCLANRANDDAACWPSYDDLAKQVGVSRRTIIRVCAGLVDRELIRKEERKRSDGSQKSCLFVLLMGQAPRGVSLAPQGVTADTPPCHACHPGGVTPVTPGVTLLSPLEPSIEPSVESKGNLKSKNARATPTWPEDYFEQFWKLYPNKVAKVAVEKAMAGVIRDGVSFDDIMAGLERYIDSKPADRPWLHM